MSALGRARALARDVAGASGALALRHRLRNDATLTVLMFHRVVTPGTPPAARADPTYTMPAPLFAACLRFLARHYHVVPLAAVLASRAGGPALPKRALLITFDDGWADNLAVAAPLLRACGLPAALFIATAPVADPADCWWQEVLLRALREGRADFATLWSAAGAAPPVPSPPPAERGLHLLLRYAALDPAMRAAALAPYQDAAMAGEGRHMLRPDDLPALAEAGVTIGAHGADHVPLSLLADPAPDLAACRRALAAWLPEGAPPALSFPHGRYGPAAVAAARAAGFSLLFTSDTCLNALAAGRPAGLLGRISVEASGIADAAGRFAPARAATWLFHRPVRRLDDSLLRPAA